MLSLNEIQSDHSRYVVLKKHDLYRDVFVYLFNDAWLDTTSRQIHVQSSTLSTYYTRQPAPTRVRFMAVPIVPCVRTSNAIYTQKARKMMMTTTTTTTTTKNAANRANMKPVTRSNIYTWPYPKALSSTRTDSYNDVGGRVKNA